MNLGYDIKGYGYAINEESIEVAKALLSDEEKSKEQAILEHSISRFFSSSAVGVPPPIYKVDICSGSKAFSNAAR